MEIVDNKIIYQQIDAVLPVLHGKNGEDGTVQGLMELAKIPVLGCGLLASALCMDKYRAHQLVKAAGIKVTRSVLVHNINDFNRRRTAMRPESPKLRISVRWTTWWAEPWLSGTTSTSVSMSRFVPNWSTARLGMPKQANHGVRQMIPIGMASTTSQ